MYEKGELPLLLIYHLRSLEEYLSPPLLFLCCLRAFLHSGHLCGSFSKPFSL